MTATTGCSAPNDKVNASVILQTKDATPVTVANCTTTGQLISVTRTATGSGYTDGTGYALGISGGGGSGATGTFDVVAGRVTNIQVTNGGSGYTSNPTISFPGAGGANAAASASTSSRCCLNSIPVGTYTLSVGIPGSTKTQDVTILCKQTTNATTSFASPSPGVGTLCATYFKCASAVGGQQIVPGTGSVTFSGPGGIVASGSFDGAGKFCAVVAAGTYTIMITGSTGATFSKTTSVSACSSGGWNLVTIDQFCAAVLIQTDPHTLGCTGHVTVSYDDGTFLGECDITLTEEVFAQGVCCIDIPETPMPNFAKNFVVQVDFPEYSTGPNTFNMLQCYPETDAALFILGDWAIPLC
ncbi:hypothetical protein [Singulisphaera sp. PoT]|uniref:hypothetical protein n=1 Tax=Singulisphaera sp. PoT TaxID=3411797 RepID=UPI003BF60BE8